MTLIKNNTGLLIRFDDIAENMNWELMDRCETLLKKYDIKPVLGVIPNNKDNELRKYPVRINFWETVHKWKNLGWKIAMHGYTHVYDNETKKKDFFGYGGKSEFFGHSLDEQTNRIKKGIEIFKKNDLDINVFFAPNHTYDENTFIALKESGINGVIDGYGLMPYTYKDIKFIPQLFYKVFLLPFGIQSSQIHINYWNEKDYINFEKFIDKNYNKIISYDEVLKKTSDEKIYRYLNKLTEKILKSKRFFLN